MPSLPFVPFENVMLVTLVQSFDNEPQVNELYFQAPSAVNTTLMEDLATELVDWADTNLAPIHHNLWSLDLIRVRDMTSQFSYVIEYDSGLPVDGTHAATGSAPTNVALVCTFRSGLAGRAFRGRNYLGGLPMAMDDPSHFTTAYRDAVVASYENLPSYLTGLNLVHCIASRYINGERRVTGAATPVISYTVNVRADSQRRRLPAG